jgi:hypothetical protein
LENKVEIPTNIKADKAADSEENELDEVEIITDDRVINDVLHFLTLLKEKDIETLVQYWTSDNSNRIYKDIDVLKDNMVDMVQLYHEIIDFDSPLEVKLLNSEVSTVNSLQIINIKNREGFFVYDDGYYRDLVISYYDDTPSFSSITLRKAEELERIKNPNWNTEDMYGDTNGNVELAAKILTVIGDIT